MNKTQQKRLGCGVGCLHFIATFFFLMLVVSAEMSALNPRYRPLPPLLVRQKEIGLALQPIFDFPLMTFARFLWGENVIEYSILVWILNSLLFGFGFAFIVKQLRKPR